MSNTPIDIQVKTAYLADKSNPLEEQYVFAYTITIRNLGNEAAKLLKRHWIITDAEGHVEEVRGDGVVGEQPNIQAGEVFEYTSGAVLNTPVGCMQGSYLMLRENGESFNAEIPA
ncbi:MAG: Co2+/Mg2+ efflux protein ApaG, partial [Bacillus cereus]|nr:Co2+/Mg2+ efflux protein ApaG [Bacillus cereus]